MGASTPLRTKNLREIVSQVRSQTFPYEPKDEVVVDFTKYTQAQVNEVNDMLESIRDTVDAAWANIKSAYDVKYTKLGRPSTPVNDVAKVLLMQSYFGISNRVTEGFERLFREKLGISKHFSYKTIERGYDPDRVVKLLDEVFRLTNEIGNSHENKFSVDGTGDPTSTKVNYENSRARQNAAKDGNDISDSFPTAKSAQHDFQYSVHVVGVHTKVVAGFITTGNHHVGELSFLASTIAHARSNCPTIEDSELCGDGLYANRNAVKVVAKYHITPYFLPKSNATFRSHGVPEWKQMTYALTLDPIKWPQSYHDRSISETSNSMIKNANPNPLRKRLPHRRDVEETLRYDVHNLRQCCYLAYVGARWIKEPKWAN